MTRPGAEAPQRVAATTSGQALVETSILPVLETDLTFPMFSRIVPLCLVPCRQLRRAPKSEKPYARSKILSELSECDLSLV